MNKDLYKKISDEQERLWDLHQPLDSEENRKAFRTAWLAYLETQNVTDNQFEAKGGWGKSLPEKKMIREGSKKWGGKRNENNWNLEARWNKDGFLLTRPFSSKEMTLTKNEAEGLHEALGKFLGKGK